MNENLKKYIYSIIALLFFSFSLAQFAPGTIQVESAITCYNGTVSVNNLTLGTGGGGLVSLSYDWELSTDNGTTWKKISNESQGEVLIDYLINGGDKLTINGLKKTIQVRREFIRTPLVGSSSSVYSPAVTVQVQQENAISFPSNVNSFAIQQGTSFTLPTPSSVLPSTFQITNRAGTIVSGTLSNLSKGEHFFTYKATTNGVAGSLAGCETFATVRVIVYDLENCNLTVQRRYATHQYGWATGLSAVNNAANAVNGDRSQYATLAGGVVLLGIGTVGIDLYFTKPDGTLYSGEELRNKKVTIKLGEQYSALKLIGGMSVVGRNASTLSAINTSSTSLNSGSSFSVKGGLLDLLKGDNVFEYSFVPAASNGSSVPYNGVRIMLSSLLGVADNASVFHAYIEDDVEVNPETNSCTNANAVVVNPSPAYPSTQNGVSVINSPITLNQFVEDVTWGNVTAGLNLATALSTVNYPYYAVDNDYNSYAIFNTTAGVLNQQFLNVGFRQNARPGDQVQITLGTENASILTLGLLNLSSYRIKYFLGETEVGIQTLDQFKLLDLGLLRLTQGQKIVISSPISIPFDHVRIEQFNTVNVNLGNQFYVYDVRVNPQMLFEGQTDPKQITTVCAADYLAIQTMDYCTTYEVSFAEVTESGDQLRDENGQLIVDSEGNPVYSILSVSDIPNSQLRFSHHGANMAYYEIDRMYNEYQGKLAIKIQTKRQGCNYGDAQYLRVNLINCNEALINPAIRTGIK